MMTTAIASPTPSSTASQTSRGARSGTTPIGGIVGGVVGGIVGCATMALALLYMRRRSRRRSLDTTSPTEPAQIQTRWLDPHPFMLDQPTASRLPKGEWKYSFSFRRIPRYVATSRNRFDLEHHCTFPSPKSATSSARLLSCYGVGCPSNLST